jgi:hypothetical protein
MLISLPSFADSCASFAGNFEAQLSCQGISPHSGIQIGYFSPNQSLILIYDPGHHPMAAQTYTSDGAEHTGDVNNTGDTYTASCTGNVMKIRRIFSALKYPLVEEITLNSNGLDYVETFEGRDGATVCRFERTALK